MKYRISGIINCLIDFIIQIGLGIGSALRGGDKNEKPHIDDETTSFYHIDDETTSLFHKKVRS